MALFWTFGCTGSQVAFSNWNLGFETKEYLFCFVLSCFAVSEYLGSACFSVLLFLPVKKNKLIGRPRTTFMFPCFEVWIVVVCSVLMF